MSSCNFNKNWGPFKAVESSSFNSSSHHYAPTSSCCPSVNFIFAAPNSIVITGNTLELLNNNKVGVNTGDADRGGKIEVEGE